MNNTINRRKEKKKLIKRIYRAKNGRDVNYNFYKRILKDHRYILSPSYNVQRYNSMPHDPLYIVNYLYCTRLVNKVRNDKR